MKPEFFPHQCDALKASEALTRVAYYWDMGLGKTFVGAEKLNRLGADTNLIVCQKSKLADWKEHLNRYYPQIEVRDLTKKAELEDFLSHYTVWHGYGGASVWVGIINYDLIFRRKPLLELTDFTLLLDESSLIQNEKAQRTKFVLRLKASNVILLSGTPVSGKYENLWSQIHLLGWGISNDLYNRQFVNWETVDMGGFPLRRVNPKEPYKNVDRLKAKLREYGAFFLKTDECFDLPEQRFIEVKIPAIPEYRRFRRDKIVTAPDGCELIGSTSLTERLYARQLCGHYNEYKVQAFRDLLDSTRERLVVFYNFNAELEVLTGCVLDAGRPLSQVNGHVKDLSAYEAEDDSVTLIQYQAGAMGLNLQKASRIVYFTLTDKSELFEQSKKRIHRIGQSRPCTYYLLLCEKSVEEVMLRTLEQRKDFTDELFKQTEV